MLGICLLEKVLCICGEEPGSGRLAGESQHCFHKNGRGGAEGVRKRLQEIPAPAHPPGRVPARLSAR